MIETSLEGIDVDRGRHWARGVEYFRTRGLEVSRAWQKMSERTDRLWAKSRNFSFRAPFLTRAFDGSSFGIEAVNHSIIRPCLSIKQLVDRIQHTHHPLSVCDTYSIHCASIS